MHEAWSGFKAKIAAPFVQAQIAADQPQIDKANKAQKAAEDASARAQSDTAACIAAAKDQSDNIARLNDLANRNMAAAKAARAQAAKEATAAAPQIAEWQRQAAAAPKLQACTDELAKAKATLAEALRARRPAP